MRILLCRTLASHENRRSKIEQTSEIQISNIFRSSRFILLIVAAVIVLTPQQAVAQNIAVSPYVQQVLDRADAGISEATSKPAALDFLLYHFFWAKGLREVFSAMVDTNLRITEQQQGLMENTACERIDLFLIEAKIERVRDEMKKAYADGNISAITRLQKIVLFLNDRYNLVLKGGRDPEFVDTAWYSKELFDAPSPGWCCQDPAADDGSANQCQSKEQAECLDAGGTYFDGVATCGSFENCKAPDDPSLEPPLCPFSTDYLPPSVAGYGCDEETLRRVIDHIDTVSGGEDLRNASTAEADALLTVKTEVEKFLDQTRAVANLQREIQILLGEDPSDQPEPLPEREHKTKNGCVLPDEEPWPEGAVQIELRGPFAPSPEKDENRIIRAFRELRQRQGGMRAPSSLYELRSRQNLFQWIINNAFQWLDRQYSIEQGSKETTTFAVGSDPVLQLKHTLQPFTEAVQTLSELAQNFGNSGNPGLRDFVRDYAVFMRRSCIYRPCNQRLEQVLKIIFQDACFPYTDGDYLNTDSDFEECKNAAGLNVQ